MIDSMHKALAFTKQNKKKDIEIYVSELNLKINIFLNI